MGLQKKKKYKEKCQQIRAMNKDTEEEALLRFKDKLNPSFFKILQCQLRNADRKPQGRRYTGEEKVIFVGIHERGANCYRGLPIIKPTRKTIRTTIKKMNFKPCVNKVVVDSLASRAASITDEARKEVLIVFVWIAGKRGFHYNPDTDSVLGFVDFGDGKRYNVPAEKAMGMHD